MANDLLPCPHAGRQLGRFWAHRGEDGAKRGTQLLIDFLCTSAGGPMYHRGRDTALTHRGMRISENDWNGSIFAETSADDNHRDFNEHNDLHINDNEHHDHHNPMRWNFPGLFGELPRGQELLLGEHMPIE